MTVTVLASFSLLALVVTARPIQPNSNDFPQVDAPPLDVRNAVQSVFQSRVGQPAECFGCDSENIQVHVTSAEEQDAVLSELDDLDAIKALVPLSDDVPKTEDEQKLYELFTGLRTASAKGSSLNDLDGAVPPTPEKSLGRVDDAESHATDTAYTDILTSLYDFGSGRVFTLFLACVAASMALGCLIGMLYLKYLVTGNVSGFEHSENSSSCIEKQEIDDTSTSDVFSDSHYGDEKLGLLFLDIEAPKAGTIFDEKFDTDTDTDEPDESFHDAQPFTSPLVPRLQIFHADPDLLPLPSRSHTPTPYSTPTRTLRRLPSKLSLVSPSKPAWSLRASDAPALGLSPSASPYMRTVSPEPASIPIPGAYVPDAEAAKAVERPAPRRAYLAPMPELDIAFAMQLRPGLGLGADPAWFVRFLMAMFGWMTVLIGGSGNARNNRRMITA